MKIVTGDLIELAKEGAFDVIFHGCNCFHTMGGGIARQIASNFPEALRADANTKYGDRSKLGTWSKAAVTSHFNAFEVWNVYTQYMTSLGQDVFEYQSFESFLKLSAKTLVGKRVGYPAIGSGLAMGNWDTISSLIQKHWSTVDHTLVLLPGEAI